MIMGGIRADRATLLELAERVEAGTGEDRDTDTEIWRLLCDGHPTRSPLPWDHCYTSSLDAVVALIERVLPPVSGWDVSRYPVGVLCGEEHVVMATVSDPGVIYQDGMPEGLSATPARALLAATLKALAGKLADATNNHPKASTP